MMRINNGSVILGLTYKKFRYAINWIKPNFNNELGEYFENNATKEYFEKQGLVFKDKNELVDFLSTGAFKLLRYTQLNKNYANMSLTDKDFQKELKDPGYALSYSKMVRDLERTGKLTLPAPILIQFGDLYYGFSGNRRMNLAFKYDIPIRFWLVPFKKPEVAEEPVEAKFKVKSFTREPSYKVMVAYHGTVKAYADDIVKNGYKACENLTISKEFAEAYAILHALTIAMHGYKSARKSMPMSKNESGARVVILKGKVTDKGDTFFSDEKECATPPYEDSDRNPYLKTVSTYIPKITTYTTKYLNRVEKDYNKSFKYSDKTGIWEPTIVKPEAVEESTTGSVTPIVKGAIILSQWGDDEDDDPFNADEEADIGQDFNTRKAVKADFINLTQALDKAKIKYTLRKRFIWSVGIDNSPFEDDIYVGVPRDKKRGTNKYYVTIVNNFVLSTPTDRPGRIVSRLKFKLANLKSKQKANEIKEKELLAKGLLDIHFTSTLNDWVTGAQGGELGGAQESWYNLLKDDEDKIPTKYRKGGVLYRGIYVDNVDDILSGKKKLRQDKISSWTRDPKYADYHAGHRNNSSIMLKKDVTSDKIFIDVGAYFSKANVKLINKEYNLSVHPFAASEQEVIIKDVQLTPEDIIWVYRNGNWVAPNKEVTAQTNKIFNPQIWTDLDSTEPVLREDVLRHILSIADEFHDFIGIDTKYEDVWFTGSMANYNYTDASDIDVHLIYDFEKIDENKKLVDEMMKAKKGLWNEKHDIKIKGHDVEIYAQDKNEQHHATGIYSVLNDKWIRVPSKTRPNIDLGLVKQKAEALKVKINQALQTQDLDKIQAIQDKLKLMRQSGLERQGEYSVENLVFKFLRNDGTIEKLVNTKTEILDKQLSLSKRRT